MHWQRKLGWIGLMALVLVIAGCGGGHTGSASTVGTTEFHKGGPGIHGGGHIGKPFDDWQMAKVCDAIDILRQLGNSPQLIGTARGAKYRKADRVLHHMKITGRLAYECGAGYLPALAWCMRDGRSSKRGDRINVTARGLRKSPASLAGVLFHEYIHTCQGYDNGFPGSPQGRNGRRIELCAYWRQYCFLRDAQAAGLDVSDSINMWRGYYGGIYDFPSLYDADPLTYPDKRFRCYRCDRRRRGGYVFRFGAPPPQTSFTFDASEFQPKIRQARFDDGTHHEFASGLDRIDNVLAYQPAGRGIVLLVAGEQGSGYAIRRFEDADGDGNVDAASGAVVVGRAVGVGSIGGMAWMPGVAGDSVFALDTRDDVIYRLADANDDGLPDSLGSVYANADVFPELEEASTLMVHGEYGVTSLVLAAYMQPWSVVTCGYWSGLTYIELSDNDGDGAAGTATAVLSQDEEMKLRPAVTGSAHAGQAALEVHGSVGCTFEVRAFASSTGSYSEILGSAVSDAHGFATILLDRALALSDTIAVFDATNEQGIENLAVVADAEPWVKDASETMGMPEGGTTITFTGEDLPTDATAAVWFGDTQGTVVSRASSTWVVRSPAHAIPEGRFAVVPVEIRDSSGNAIEATHFAYVPYRLDGMIDGRVFADANQNGVGDLGEEGIPGSLVELVDVGSDGVAGSADDVVVAAVTTRADGSYLFSESMPPGTYVVSLDPSSLPAGMHVPGGQNDILVEIQDGDAIAGVQFGCH